MRRAEWVRRAVTFVALLAGGAAHAAPGQLPPIGIRVDPLPGWEETAAQGAAIALRRRGGDGKVLARFNVVITESERQGGAVDDPGVAEGLEAELLGVLPGARVVERAPVFVGSFKAYRLTVEASVGGKPTILRQTTVDVRRGVVTVTAAVDAASAPGLLPEVDRMVAEMAIDAVIPAPRAPDA